MSLWSLTQERVTKLLEEKERKAAELAELEATDAQTFYRRDLGMWSARCVSCAYLICALVFVLCVWCGASDEVKDRKAAELAELEATDAQTFYRRNLGMLCVCANVRMSVFVHVSI